MKARILLLVSLVVVGGCNQVVTTNIAGEVHYSPTENLEHIDIDLIAQAQRSIDMDAYALTDFAVADALVSAAGRGVQVRIYRDNTQTDGELARANKGKKARTRSASDQEDMDDAEDANSAIVRLGHTRNVQVLVKHSRTLMHLKAYCVDGKILRTGSANFSPTGEKRQDNDLVILRDPASIARFEGNFNAIWARPDNEALPR